MYPSSIPIGWRGAQFEEAEATAREIRGQKDPALPATFTASGPPLGELRVGQQATARAGDPWQTLEEAQAAASTALPEAEGGATRTIVEAQEALVSLGGKPQEGAEGWGLAGVEGASAREEHQAEVQRTIQSRYVPVVDAFCFGLPYIQHYWAARSYNRVEDR